MMEATGVLWIDILVGLLVLAGAFFVLVAGVGVFRLQDIMMRMHAATKAGALGVGLILAAVAVHFGEVGITTRAVAGIAFIILTAPVAAHLIGRAAYFSGVPLWEKTRSDALAEYYTIRDTRSVPVVERVSRRMATLPPESDPEP